MSNNLKILSKRQTIINPLIFSYAVNNIETRTSCFCKMSKCSTLQRWLIYTAEQELFSLSLLSF